MSTENNNAGDGRDDGPRRSSPRVETGGDRIVRWTGNAGTFDAVICDLSYGGCYLNTRADADMGEIITIHVPTFSTPEEILDFTGTVVTQNRHLKGFGVTFSALTPAQETLIARLMTLFPEQKDDRDL